VGCWLNKDPIPQSPCPPDQFSGRSDKREQILEILERANRQGQIVMISGARGSGKTSFLIGSNTRFKITRWHSKPSNQKIFL
jgi:tRNA A37 threonylcarbamoyladenosine biosynthesis protein TsaE